MGGVKLIICIFASERILEGGRAVDAGANMLNTLLYTTQCKKEDII